MNDSNSAARVGKPADQAEFDHYSGNYEEALQQGISVSGESSTYFAVERIRWLAKRLGARRYEPRSVIDFGCGVGNSLPILSSQLHCQRIAGIDISPESISVARQRFAGESFELGTLTEVEANANFDLAFCNGVFHHIPLDERLKSAQLVFRHLRSGGLFALFENNPLNPGTRYVMSRIPFDRDAITLLPGQARQLLRQANFEILRTDFLFYFPRALSMFRPLEPWLNQLPLGAQYMVLARKV